MRSTAQFNLNVTTSPSGGIGTIEAGGVMLFVAPPGENVPEAQVTILLPFDHQIIPGEPRLGCAWRRLGDPPLPKEEG